MRIYGEEHQIFQETVRKFCEKEVLPFVDKWEEEENFPSNIFEKLGAQGFLGILIDEKDGGVGGDLTLAAAWCEEFGRVPATGFCIAVNMHSLVITPTLARFASEEAKSKLLADAIAGKAIGAYAFTEPGAGSDLTQVRTTAVDKGDHWLLNGTKIFITNGARADFVLVLAKTDPSKGYQGYTTFVVETKLAGFSVARKLSKLGWHSSDTAELVFENMKIPKGMVLGEVGKGWTQAMQSLEWERLMLSLTALGGAGQCLEDTIRYTNERKLFNQTVADFDYTKELIASYWSKLEAARAYCHHALKLIQDKKRCRKEVSLAKVYTTELAIQIADKCLQLHGGYGYTTEFSPERWLRDLRLNTIGGGTTEVMKQIAAKETFE